MHSRFSPVPARFFSAKKALFNTASPGAADSDPALSYGKPAIVVSGPPRRYAPRGDEGWNRSCHYSAVIASEARRSSVGASSHRAAGRVTAVSGL